MLIKPPHDSKLRVTANAWEDKSRIRNDLATTEKQPGGAGVETAPKMVQFNQNKCKIVHWGAHTELYPHVCQSNPKELIVVSDSDSPEAVASGAPLPPASRVRIYQRPCTSLKQLKCSQFPPPSQKLLVKIPFTSQEISCAATVISVNAILIS